MMLESHGSGQKILASSIVRINDAFAFVFGIEAVLKISADGMVRYFRVGWNCFDFGVAAVSLAGVAVSLTGGAATSFLSIFRIFRVARVFRLIPKAKGLRTLFNALVFSLPALCNVATVGFLLYFVFAILGMSLFGHVLQPGYSCLARRVNFVDFGSSLEILARSTTGENWNCIMHACMVLKACLLLTVPPDDVVLDSLGSASAAAAFSAAPWGPGWPGAPTGAGAQLYVDYDDPLGAAWSHRGWDNGAYGDFYDDRCAPLHSAAPAIVYFCFFMILNAFVMINLVTAVLINNFESSKTDEDCVLTATSLAQFVAAWSELDLRGTAYIKAVKLEALIRAVQRPLGASGVRRSEERRMALKISQSVVIPVHNGYVHFLEVLHALTARLAYTRLQPGSGAGSVQVAVAIAKRMPGLQLPQQAVRYTAAHVLAAYYVQSAVRGFLSRRTEARMLAQRNASVEAGGARASSSGSSRLLERGMDAIAAMGGMLPRLRAINSLQSGSSAAPMTASQLRRSGSTVDSVQPVSRAFGRLFSSRRPVEEPDADLRRQLSRTSTANEGEDATEEGVPPTPTPHARGSKAALGRSLKDLGAVVEGETVAITSQRAHWVESLLGARKQPEQQKRSLLQAAMAEPSQRRAARTGKGAPSFEDSVLGRILFGEEVGMAADFGMPENLLLQLRIEAASAGRRRSVAGTPPGWSSSVRLLMGSLRPTSSTAALLQRVNDALRSSADVSLSSPAHVISRPQLSSRRIRSPPKIPLTPLLIDAADGTAAAAPATN